jgi:hypothetical protein
MSAQNSHTDVDRIGFLRDRLLDQEGRLQFENLDLLNDSDWCDWIRARLEQRDPILEMDPEQNENPMRLFLYLYEQNYGACANHIDRATARVLQEAINEDGVVKDVVTFSRFAGTAALIITIRRFSLEEAVLRAINHHIAESNSDSDDNPVVGLLSILYEWNFRFDRENEELWQSMRTYSSSLGFDCYAGQKIAALLVSISGKSGIAKPLSYCVENWSKIGFSNAINFSISSIIYDMCMADITIAERNLNRTLAEMDLPDSLITRIREHANAVGVILSQSQLATEEHSEDNNCKLGRGFFDVEALSP